MQPINVTKIEPIAIPSKYEQDFLRHIGEKLGLQEEICDTFVARLCEKNLDATWEEVVKSSKSSWVSADQARKNYWSRVILPKLKDLGFKHDNGNGKKVTKAWVQARQWLVETQFEPWFKPWLWEQLTQKAQKTDQMGVKDPRDGDHLGMVSKNNYLDKVTLNREVIFELQLPQPGHLTLLEREPNGTVVCLCPSHFARKSQFTQENRVILPQPNNLLKVFQPNELGTEQLLALLTRESPGFDWLEKSRQEAMPLQPSQLQQMFEYVKQKPHARLLYTEYQVVEQTSAKL